MKKQLGLFILLFCCFFCFSCASQKKEIITKSTIKLEGKNTNIRDLIEIDGYFHDEDFGSNLMFFADGTYVWQFQFKEGAIKDSVKTNMSKWIHTWTENGRVRWGSYWGVCRIQGDTIIGNSFVKGTFLSMGGWIFNEERYKIVDKTTIKKVYIKGLLKADESYYKLHSPWIRYDNYFYFIPANSLPSSNNWLKEEKWTWRNERDWKDYKEKIKQEKIKRK
jgi:hypothetical protein